MNTKSTFKVTGMSCAGCAGNVEKALKAVSGVSGVIVDLKGGKAIVEFDPAKADQKALAKAVKEAGYGVG
jgi:P-type Cu+ transporter